MSIPNRISICCLMLSMLVLASCGGHEPRPQSGVMDTPLHHFENGLRSLDSGAASEARRSFNTALDLAPDYGPAQAGLGLVLALEGSEQGLDRIEDGMDDAVSPVELLWCRIMEIRALTALANAHVLNEQEMFSAVDEASEECEYIVESTPEAEVPELYMALGEAYLRALKFAKAERMFERVVSMNRGLTDRAEERWSLTQKIRRAAPRTSVGVQIALSDRVTRADMAALLTEELDVAKFYGRTEPVWSPTFRPPSATASTGTPMPSDISDHPMARDIETVLSLGVRGLESYSDGSFHPDQPLARLEAAMIFEDIIVRAKNDPALATRFIGEPSPFPDLAPEHPGFNAAMVCVTRGFFDTDARNGRFGPTDSLSGAEAVLAINRLVAELGVF